MAEREFKERLPENAAVRALFGRVAVNGDRLGKVEAVLNTLVTHKALIGYGALFVSAVAGAVWAIMVYFHGIQKDEVIEIKANAYRQETKVDAIKDLIMTGSVKSWVPTPAPAPEVKAFIEQAKAEAKK
jgi:fructose 1,6-bisphosphatase